MSSTLIKIHSKDESSFRIDCNIYRMRQRKVLRDNEWTGLRWIRTCFEKGKIIEYQKSDLELEKWFDPAFGEFINKEISSTGKENK